MKKLPKRELIILVLNNLINDVENRKNAADWAMSFVDNDDIELNDLNAWRVLKRIGSADLPASEGGYLYNIEDFISWKKELI